MIPKFTALARSRCSESTSSTGDPRNLGRGAPMDVLALRKRVEQALVARSSARGCEARPASSRPRAARGPSAGMKASRIRMPSEVRIGMFWTFGSEAESRPVAAPIWLKFGMDAPGLARLTSLGRASMYVLFNFDRCRHSKNLAGQWMLRGQLFEDRLRRRIARLGLLERWEPQLVE